MRVDGETAFRTRQAAHKAARDSPNILACRSADMLLDGLFAAERREPVPGLSATSRASTYPPGNSVPAIKPSFGGELIDPFLSGEDKNRPPGRPPGRSPADIVLKGAPDCTALAVF